VLDLEVNPVFNSFELLAIAYFTISFYKIKQKRSRNWDETTSYISHGSMHV